MKNIQGYIFVDNDGTFIPGTEKRNRVVLQSIVDVFAKAAKVRHSIDWNLCAGQAEPKIHDLICQNGFADLKKHITRDDFERAAKEGYQNLRPDFAPREDMIKILLDYKARGIMPVLVTNSERDIIEEALDEAFAKTEFYPEDVFEVIVTKTEVLDLGLNLKPAPDPYRLAHEVADEYYGAQVPKDKVVVLEDSPTGVQSGFCYTQNRSQVIQFTDMTPAHEDARHHVVDMKQCRDAMERTFASIKGYDKKSGSYVVPPVPVAAQRR